MQHALACKHCGKSTMSAEAVTDLEYTCPWCRRVTVFDLRQGSMKATLTRGDSPEQFRGERKTEAFDRMMRTNRGIDGTRC